MPEIASESFLIVIFPMSYCRFKKLGVWNKFRIRTASLLSAYLNHQTICSPIMVLCTVVDKSKHSSPCPILHPNKIYFQSSLFSSFLNHEKQSCCELFSRTERIFFTSFLLKLVFNIYLFLSGLGLHCYVSFSLVVASGAAF